MYLWSGRRVSERVVLAAFLAPFTPSNELVITPDTHSPLWAHSRRIPLSVWIYIRRRAAAASAVNCEWKEASARFANSLFRQGGYCSWINHRRAIQTKSRGRTPPPSPPNSLSLLVCERDGFENKIIVSQRNKASLSLSLGGAAFRPVLVPKINEFAAGNRAENKGETSAGVEQRGAMRADTIVNEVSNMQSDHQFCARCKNKSRPLMSSFLSDAAEKRMLICKQSVYFVLQWNLAPKNYQS